MGKLLLFCYNFCFFFFKLCTTQNIENSLVSFGSIVIYALYVIMFVCMARTCCFCLFLSFFSFYYTIQAQYASILKLNRIGFFFLVRFSCKFVMGCLKYTQSTICMLHIRIIEILFIGVSIVSSVVWLTTQTRNSNKCQLQPPKNNIQNLFELFHCLLSKCVYYYNFFFVSKLFATLRLLFSIYFFFHSYSMFRVLVLLFSSQQIQIFCWREKKPSVSLFLFFWM